MLLGREFDKPDSWRATDTEKHYVYCRI